MAPPQSGDVLVIPFYSEEDEQSLTVVKWSQNLATKSAKFYIPRAKNQSCGNENVLLYVQDRFLKDEGSNDFIGKIPGVSKDQGNWIIKIGPQFQYGQKNATGEKRFIVLQDKNNAMFQHRFLTTTIQGDAVGWAKTLAGSFGAGELADQVNSMGSSFVGDKMKTFP